MEQVKLFLEKSSKAHSNKYDYGLVEYVNARTKVKIIYTKPELII
jgi:hypothetical protein